MPDLREIDFVFLDIGGTLGERNPSNGNFVAFPSSAGLLKAMRDELSLGIGIITTLGPQLTNADGTRPAQDSRTRSIPLSRRLHIGSHAGVPKPSLEIYRFAAQRVGVPIDRCLFIGENLIEVIGATAAGMKAVLKPCPPGRDLPS